MMAVIGFLLTFGAGAFCLIGALLIIRVSVGFSGKIEWPGVIVLGTIGTGLLYMALTHSPFTITIN